MNQMEQKEEASFCSYDDYLLYGTDSDDSFVKDYTISRAELRRERMAKKEYAEFLKSEEERRERARLAEIEAEKQRILEADAEELAY